MPEFQKTDAFTDADDLLAQIDDLIPSNDDPVLKERFQPVARLMADYLLARRAYPDRPVAYNDFFNEMSMGNLFVTAFIRRDCKEKWARKWVPQDEVTASFQALQAGIRSYFEHLCECSWADIFNHGIPSYAWARHNYPYHFLAPRG